MAMKKRQHKADEQKFKELVLYVAARSDEDPSFGAVKLNKILFYSDFLFFAETGKPITGMEYRKYPHGPAPAKMKVIKAQLEGDGAAYEYINPLQRGYRQRRLLANRKPDLSKFTAEEIATVDRVLEMFRFWTGRDVSEKSHCLPGWQLAKDAEEIPYFTALIPDNQPELTDEELTWVRQVGNRLASSAAPARAAR